MQAGEALSVPWGLEGETPRINGSCQIVPSCFLQFHSKDHVGQRLLSLLSCEGEDWEDGDGSTEDWGQFAECWASTLLFLPWVQTRLQDVGPKSCSIGALCP